MGKLRVGIIGNGKAAHRYHLPYIVDSGVYEVVVMYARSENGFEMPYPIDLNIVRDIEQFYHYRLDLVVIATPHNTHYDIAKDCIKRGINCLVEKPFTTSSVEAKELFDMAFLYNVKLVAFQNRRYDTDFISFKNIIHNEMYGKVMEIESNHTYNRSSEYNRSLNKVDGMVFGHAVHYIDQILSVYGKPNKILSDTYCQRTHFYLNDSVNYVEDFYDIKFIYDTFRVRIRYSPAINHQPPSWIIHTNKYSFIKQNRDQQERDLKNGTYPYDENFGLDDDCFKKYKDNEFIYNIGNPLEVSHTEFYLDLYKYIKLDGESPVKKEETIELIKILEELVNNTTLSF